MKNNSKYDYVFQPTELQLLSAEAKEFTKKLIRRYNKTDFYRNLSPSEVAFRATWKGLRYLHGDKDKLFEKEIHGYGRMSWDELFTFFGPHKAVDPETDNETPLFRFGKEMSISELVLERQAKLVFDFDNWDVKRVSTHQFIDCFEHFYARFLKSRWNIDFPSVRLLGPNVARSRTSTRCGVSRR